MTKPCETGAQCLGGKCRECVPTYEFECPRCGHCCQQREWIGLTEEELEGLSHEQIMVAIATEAALKDKNT